MVSSALLSSVSSKGGVSAVEKMVIASAFTSTSPVAMFGFLCPPRSATVPAIAMQYSRRSSPDL